MKHRTNARRGGTTAMALPSLLTHCLILLVLLCCYSCSCPTASALEATFTPNPADAVENGGDGGPLPASLEQRKQLLELEAAIVNSADPAATLGHVAKQNGMSDAELAGMLDRNRKELAETGQLEGMQGEANAAVQAQMAAGGGGGRSMAGSLPRRIIGLVVSIITALLRTVSVQMSRHPKQSTLLITFAAVALLAVHSAPRNGIAISNGGSFPPWSRGHTTVLEPPMEYLEEHCVGSWERGGWVSSLPEPIEVKVPTKKKSSKSKKQSVQVVGGVGMTRSLEVDTSNAEEGEVAVETATQSDGFALITTAHTLVTLDGCTDGGDSDDEEEAMECLRDSVRSILDERRFSEFITTGGRSRSLKFGAFLVTSELNDDGDVTEGAVLAMKLLGDFGRYGVQPLCVSYEMDNDDEGDGEEPMVHCVAFHTLTGGHFDGELRFLVQEEIGDSNVAVSVTLAVPQGGRAPPKRLAESMVSSFTESIARSCQIRTKQTMSRRRQSGRYRATASGRASKKRHLRYEQERAQEEMAADRKRKWKRNNPDAGSYRPTGQLRNPNNGSGPRHGF